MPSKSAAYDLEEQTPNRFVVRHPQLRGLLKREGVFHGMLFELTTWRRDGLLARLRERGFSVQTIDDLIRGLPDLPHAVPVGPPWLRRLAQDERISWFAPSLRWEPVPIREQTPATVELRPGWVIRRRQSRGAARYALVGNGGALQPANETAALLQGYANQTPATITVLRHESGILLPDLELPAAHTAVLRRISAGAPWVPEPDWPLAEWVFERLQLRLRVD